MVFSVAPVAARWAAVSALILGLAAAVTPAAAAVTPAAAAVTPAAAATGRTPGWARAAGLWRPTGGAGTWGPVQAVAPGWAPAGPAAASPAPSASPAPGSPWRLQRTPNPAIPNGMLLADSCTSPGACIAVGGYENTAGTQVALAEARTPTGWRILATSPPPGAVLTNLFGVSCTAPGACTAVGYYIDAARHIHPLAERWNGTAWRIQAVPSPAGHPLAGFFAVSCPAADACTAVGAQTSGSNVTTALAERWNGTAWSIQAVPGPTGALASELLAVSCSAPGACTTVGADVDSANTSVPLAERWNGTAWRVQTVPAPPGSPGSGLTGVSCASAAACTAVGSFDAGANSTALLAAAWNGTDWQIQATSAPSGATGSEFLAVSCSAAAACTAVGAVMISGPAAHGGSSGGGMTVSLAERWNGTAWRVQVTPNSGRSVGGGFAAVSCSAAAACTAAGSFATASGLSRPTAAAWGGTKWRLQATPSREGASISSGLVGLSCVSPRACTAAGFTTNTVGEGTTLAERWDGTQWRIQPAPVPAGAVSATFDAVSCPSPGACTAVGNYFGAGQRELALAERWSGGHWALQPVPLPPKGSQGSQLSGVSCPSADHCVASGWYFTASGSVSFAAAWDGTRWRIQQLPGPARAGHLFGVSCASPGACVAVGDHGTEVWNGTGWRYVAMAAPAGATAPALNGVSCTSATFCAAAGDYFSMRGGPLTLAETWDGTAWRARASPNPQTSGRNQLNTVSCTSSRACTAVGVDAASDFAPPGGFAESWDGTSWRLVPVPAPAGAVLTELFGVSCTFATCTAVGTAAGQSNIGVTLAMTTAGT